MLALGRDNRRENRDRPRGHIHGKMVRAEGALRPHSVYPNAMFQKVGCTGRASMQLEDLQSCQGLEGSAPWPEKWSALPNSPGRAGLKKRPDVCNPAPGRLACALTTCW